jgi:Uma2 family endonuclease
LFFALATGGTCVEYLPSGLDDEAPFENRDFWRSLGPGWLCDAGDTMLLSKPARMTGEEFLDWQEKQDTLYELVDGVPMLLLKMMAGATQRHDAVTVRCLSLLDQQLRGRSCRPMTADIAVRILDGASFRRPDITVDCGNDGTDRTTTASDPRVVIEVLSPSTINFSRFRKVEEFKTVASIVVIVLLDTELPQATIHRRVAAREWQVTSIEGLDQINDLPEIGARLPLVDVYERLTFT